MTHDKLMEVLSNLDNYMFYDWKSDENLDALEQAITVIDRAKRVAKELKHNKDTGYSPTPQRCGELARILMLELGID
jgi:hypothetical protein